jgi:hypothetical protein
MTKTDPDRFRKEAAECREQAAKAIGQLDKDTWLRLAAEWIKLAQAAEQPACAVASSLPMLDMASLPAVSDRRLNSRLIGSPDERRRRQPKTSLGHVKGTLLLSGDSTACRKQVVQHDGSRVASSPAIVVLCPKMRNPILAQSRWLLAWAP